MKRKLDWLDIAETVLTGLVAVAVAASEMLYAMIEANGKRTN